LGGGRRAVGAAGLRVLPRWCPRGDGLGHVFLIHVRHGPVAGDLKSRLDACMRPWLSWRMARLRTSPRGGVAGRRTPDRRLWARGFVPAGGPAAAFALADHRKLFAVLLRRGCCTSSAMIWVKVPEGRRRDFDADICRFPARTAFRLLRR